MNSLKTFQPVYEIQCLGLKSLERSVLDEGELSTCHNSSESPHLSSHDHRVLQTSVISNLLLLNGTRCDDKVILYFLKMTQR